MLLAAAAARPAAAEDRLVRHVSAGSSPTNAQHGSSWAEVGPPAAAQMRAQSAEEARVAALLRLLPEEQARIPRAAAAALILRGGAPSRGGTPLSKDLCTGVLAATYSLQGMLHAARRRALLEKRQRFYADVTELTEAAAATLARALVAGLFDAGGAAAEAAVPLPLPACAALPPPARPEGIDEIFEHDHIRCRGKLATMYRAHVVAVATPVVRDLLAAADVTVDSLTIECKAGGGQEWIKKLDRIRSGTQVDTLVEVKDSLQGLLRCRSIGEATIPPLFSDH